MHRGLNGWYAGLIVFLTRWPVYLSHPFQHASIHLQSSFAWQQLTSSWSFPGGTDFSFKKELRAIQSRLYSLCFSIERRLDCTLNYICRCKLSKSFSLMPLYSSEYVVSSIILWLVSPSTYPVQLAFLGFLLRKLSTGETFSLVCGSASWLSWNWQTPFAVKNWWLTW